MAAKELITFDKFTTQRIRRDVLSGERAPTNLRPRAYPEPPPGISTSHGIIYVKNSTGAHRERGEIIALDEALFDPEEAFETMIAPMRYDGKVDGVAIDLAASPEQWTQFGVYLEGTADGSEGQVLVAGMVPVNVEVVSLRHKYARPTTGDHTKLTSDWWGGARIMHTLTATGEQYVYCQLGNMTFPEYLGKTDAAINKNARGTVSVWDGAWGSEADSGANIESVGNRWANVGSGKWCYVAFSPLNGYPILTAAEC